MDAATSAGITVKPSEAFRCVRKVLKSGRVPMLHGSPAIGKSSIIHMVALASKLKVIDLRLSQCEPTDMLGFPYVDLIKCKSGYTPMDTFPIEGDIVPDGFNGWLLFLDELTSASPPVQAAAYKLILDKMVGQKNLHEKVFIVGAGNMESDNAVVHPMSTALQTRLVHLKLVMDVPEWLNWAMDNNFDHRIMDYISWRKDNLYTFDPNHTDLTYASPRSWHMAQDILHLGCGNDVKDEDFLALAAGCVTEGVAREFVLFTDIYKDLPNMATILANPEGAPVPSEPSTLFALTGALGNQATKDDIDKILKYVSRLPVEYQVVTMRYVVKRDRGMKSVPVVAAWLAKNIASLF